MKTKAVIFDLFGTLVPKWSSSLASETLRRVALTLEVDPAAFMRALQQTDVLRELGQLSVERGFELAAEACDVPHRERVGEISRMWLELVRRRLTPREEVSAVLATCRERGFRLGLLSDCNDDVPRIFRELPIAVMFDALGFSCQLGVMKPEARAYLEVSHRLGVAPADCVFVGDGGSNELRGAREVGMTAVWLQHAQEIELEGLPEGARAWDGAIVETLSDLWGVLDGSTHAVGKTLTARRSLRAPW
jgi:putative hydrolase of the HAD superfamily